MKIIPIQKNRAIRFVHQYHYSKILPRLSKHYLGFIEDDKLVGVVTLGWGTQPLQTIQKLFPDEGFTTDDYYEIGKMCFLPEKNESNFGSQAISLLIKWIKKNLDIKFLYTLADGIMEKCGYVYQASNFVYLGSFKTDVYMDSKTGEKIHPRSARTLLEENAKYEGKDKVFWLTHKFCEYKGIERIRGLMFRYIYPLNNKARKVVNKYDPNLPYPKENDLIFDKRVEKGRYEPIGPPNFNMDVFNHNYQKWGTNENAGKFFDLT